MAKKIRRDTIKMGEHADLTKTWDLMNEHWYMIVDVKRKKSNTISLKLVCSPF